jgi:hypothetical protein
MPVITIEGPKLTKVSKNQRFLMSENLRFFNKTERRISKNFCRKCK